MSIGVWPWIVLGLGLFLGFVALIVAIIVLIKTKKFLMTILIYLPFLFVSLALIGVFAYQVIVHYDDYNYNYDDDYWYYNYNTNTDYNYGTSYYDESNYYDGLVKNYDYNYILDVGADEELNYWVSTEYYPIDGITSTYYYCYLTSDYTYDDYYCGTGWANAFIVDVYTESQWQVVKDSPLVGTLMGQDGGYYFVFSHPNGILPDDVPSTQTYYDSVIYSIDFAD